MADPEFLDDPGPLVPRPASRARRVATVAILVLLVISMVFLAFVSGRGLVTPPPDQPGPTLPEAAGSARPEASPAPRLAIVDAAGRLTTADTAGHVSAPLGIAGVSYSFPAWSPDGRRVAVIGDDNGTGVVHVFDVGPDDVASAAPAAVYDSAEQPPFYLYWSPDGRSLSFLTTEADGIALRVAPSDASAPAEIVRQGAPMYWAWTAAGRLLVHSGGATADAFVGEIGLDGVPVEPTVTGSGAFRAPAVTADGAFRGYVTPGTVTDDRVVVETRDGSGGHAVDIHGEAALDFSPTTSDLAFIAPDEPGSQVALPVGPLRLVSAASGDVRVLLVGPVVAFFWAPDGRTIAALQIGQPNDDSVAALDGAVTARLARAPIAAPAAGYALRLVFVDTASGTIRSKRGVQIADLFAAQLLPYFDQYALSHRIWSPDSRSIALPVAAENGTSGIVIIPADGTDTTRIADGVAASWSP